jgi:hypothetical protein
MHLDTVGVYESMIELGHARTFDRWNFLLKFDDAEFDDDALERVIFRFRIRSMMIPVNLCYRILGFRVDMKFIATLSCASTRSVGGVAQ